MYKIEKYFKDIFQEYKLKYLFMFITIIFIIYILFDCLNIPSFVYNQIGLPALIIILLLFLILVIFYTNIFSLIILKSINYIDFYNIVLLSSAILCLIIQKASENTLGHNNIKDILLSTVITATIILLIMRMVLLTKSDKSTAHATNECNIISLKELYDGNIPHNIQNILIDDEAVSYDLLKRDRIINQITETLRNCNNNSRFIIALKGPWGSGKTTILNNVKTRFSNNDNVLFLDDFDPWIYENKVNLFTALFDEIMKNIKCGFRINEINLFKQSFLRTLLFQSKYISLNPFQNDIDVERIKSIIENYLERNNKRLVVVIDNLERCSNKNLLFLLNIMHNTLNFNRVIYILSYDEKAMKKQFAENLKIDYKYLEKLIQLEFTVPKENPIIIEGVIRKCLTSYFDYYNMTFESDYMNQIITILANKIRNLRDLKRILNSTFGVSFATSNHLNPIDTLAIEIIALENPDLWNNIYENGIFYISEDCDMYQNGYFLLTQKYNEDATNYFDNLFKNNAHNVNHYKSILSYLFPNVKKYIEERRIKNEGKIEFISEEPSIITDKQKSAHAASINQIRIYNNKFFNLYFYKDDNEYIAIHKNVNSFINFLNTTANFDNISEEYTKMLFTIPGPREKETLENFEINLDRINPQKYSLLLPILLSMYYITDDSPHSLSLSARQRTSIIISKILLRIQNDEFDIALQNFNTQYQDLFLIKEIAYWTNTRIERSNHSKEQRHSRIDKLFKDMKNTITTQKINMYSPENYRRHNVPLVLDNKSYAKYLHSQISSTILPLFLCDCIGYSTGSDGLAYIFNKERIESIYGWNNACHDISNSPGSKLKTFLEKALNDAKIERHFDDNYSYKTDHWTNLDFLISEYLTLIN